MAPEVITTTAIAAGSRSAPSSRASRYPLKAKVTSATPIISRAAATLAESPLATASTADAEVNAG